MDATKRERMVALLEKIRCYQGAWGGCTLSPEEVSLACEALAIADQMVSAKGGMSYVPPQGLGTRDKPLTETQTRRALRALGWVCNRGLWSTPKRGLKRHTAQGLTMRDAASIEMIYFCEREVEK